MLELGKTVLAVLIAQILLVGVILVKDSIGSKSVGRDELVNAFTQTDKVIKGLNERIKRLETAKVNVK